YGFRLTDLARKTRLLLLIAFVMLAALSAEVFSYPHYAAPITCVFVALVLLALLHLRIRTYKRATFGIWLSRLIPLFCFVVLVTRAALPLFHISLPQSLMPSIYDAVRQKVHGNLAEDALLNVPGQHLVIVHFSPDTESWMGWVHNDAD